MKFYLFKNDLAARTTKTEGTSPQLRKSTSVLRYKQWLFDCLKTQGRIIPVSDAIDKGALARLLEKPDAVFVAVHSSLRFERWRTIRHRLLRLSLGGNLLPQHLSSMKRLPRAQVDLVSTPREKELLTSRFGDLAPAFSKREIARAGTLKYS